MKENLSEIQRKGTPIVVPNRKKDATIIPNYDYIFGCNHKDKKQAINLLDYLHLLEKENELIIPVSQNTNITSILFKLKGYEYIGNKDAFCFLSKVLSKNKNSSLHCKKVSNKFKLEVFLNYPIAFEASSLRKCFELANNFFA